ncbi:MAG: alanine--tRNA ligase, partial [Phycisphaeraceae bacterium]
MAADSSSRIPAAHEVRQQYLDFFTEKCGHALVPSSPVVPHDDPTLMFANAGMNQFKPYFLGTETPPDPPRAVNTQKCIRAGGKHNDLEDVGKDTYHHTFFEMLGNWSFGDYFKAEAIDWAYHLLTHVWGLDPARLHATYFQGDPAQGLDPDDEARELWLKILPPERVHPGDAKDNFWEMGDTGPCGPCSEIHYDATPDLSGGRLVNRDDPRVIEVWNLVFIQFNRAVNGQLSPLPAKHVDTGMGFERIVRILQGKDSNYDTDVFTPIFDAIRHVTGAEPYQPGGNGENLTDANNIAYRVIADHIRCLTFALTDGATPSNEGRGYVLRRILRRAVRHGRQTLGVNEPFLHKLVQPVVNHMGEAFPELKKNGNADRVASIIEDEEASFHKTLDRGIALFEQAADNAKNSSKDGRRVSAEDAFTLYDTYGFPLDLTQVMAEERGMYVDVKGFEKLMEEARERSRAGATGGGGGQGLLDVVQRLGETLPRSEFVGYENCTELTSEKTPIAVFRESEGSYHDTADQPAAEGDRVAVAVDRTPFYATAGGQVADTGVMQIDSPSEARVQIDDVTKVGATIFHLGRVISGEPASTGDATVSLAVDKARREKIMANHTTTHVMNKALRDLVNPEADQRGSLVDDEKLRFDFSNPSAVTSEQIDKVEQQVNTDIERDLPVHAGVAPQDQALRINGLRAVFGEKYPPRVRVVAIGHRVEDILAEPEREQWKGYSIEFCGGTHLPSTGRAESFAVIAEEAVAKGVRRITALTGHAARRARQEAKRLLDHARSLENAPPTELHTAVEELNREINETTLPLVQRRELQSELGDLSERLKQYRKAEGDKAQEVAVDQARELAEAAEGPVLVASLDDVDASALRSAMDVVRKKQPHAAVLLAGVKDGKVAINACVPKPLIDKGLKAGDWVKAVAQVVGGGGGGKPDQAQAGGKDPSKLNDAL